MARELDVGDDFENVSSHKESQADGEGTVREQGVLGRRGERETVRDLDDHAGGHGEPEKGHAEFLAREHVEPEDLLGGEEGGHEGRQGLVARHRVAEECNEAACRRRRDAEAS